jgi:heme exporter protein A
MRHDSDAVMADVLIKCDGLGAVRGGRSLFTALSFEIAAGDVLLVTGANGAGKSTLLRVLAGLLAPTAGQIHRYVALAYLGHENAVKPAASVAANLRFWGVDAASAALFGLGNLLDLDARLLSAGQRRRLALCRTFGTGARLIILDEPGSGLDAANADRLADALAAHAAAGSGAIVASHGESRIAATKRLAL